MTRPDAGAATENAAEARERESLSRLKIRYEDVRGLVAGQQPYSNLDWVLGTEAEAGRTSSNLERKMIPVFALWLQDLAAEVDRSFLAAPGHPAGGGQPASPNRDLLAARLREATEEFLDAFGRRMTR